MLIESVKPRAYSRHYSNPDCQGTLMRQTELWPVPAEEESHEYNWCLTPILGGEGLFSKPKKKQKERGVPVPAGLHYDAAYMDRMQQWDYDKYREAIKLLSKGFDSPGDELIAFAKAYFGKDIVAVRTIYYFNVSNGYDCPVMEILYRDQEEKQVRQGVEETESQKG